MNEHKVWEILQRDKYTEEGSKRAEQIYDFLSAMKKTVGELTMRELFTMWNENSSETFRILSALVSNTTTATNKLSSF